MNKITILIFSLMAINVFGQTDDPNWCSEGDQTIIKINPNSITPPLPPTVTPTTPPPPPAPPEGDRIVFWLHGLAGTSNSWSNSSTAASSMYQLTPVLPTYSSFSLATAAADLHFNALLPLGLPHMQVNNIDDPMGNFIIAHSQGGIVSRATDKFYIDQNYADDDRMFGGIATFGTPHGGAQIINNVPDILDYTSYSCSTLGLPFTLETVSNSFLGSIITGLGVASTEEIVDAGCNFISNEVFPIIGEDFLAPITEEYKVGAPVLAELNATPHAIPRVAFHGVEDEPVMWRTLYSLQNEVNAQSTFGADNDDGLIEIADANATAYMMKYLTYEALLEVKQNDGCPWWSWITNPLGCLADLIYDDIFNLDYYLGLSESQTEELMNAYFAGWHWWLNANDSYKTLIGAKEFVSESTSGECVCTTTNPDGSTSTYTFDTGGEESCNSFGNTNCVYSEFTTYIGVDYASDGVVLAESAMAFPGADVGQDNEMTGSNHQQMRNDSNLKAELEELFGGAHGPYFSIPAR